MNRPPDLGQLMRQAQQMQQEMLKAQAELAQRRFEGSAGGGMVTATVTGGMELVDVHISPEVVDPSDVEMLEDLVTAAVRQALEAASAAANESIGEIGGGLGGILG